MKKAQQGARANVGICHASCYRRSFEMKLPKVNVVLHAARQLPAWLIFDVRQNYVHPAS
jgi:hypothetical protein